MMEYLKCDATGCDHRENVGTITADMIGMPCSKCGANLLTESDYKAGRRIVWVLKAFKFLGLVKEHRPGDPIPENKKLMNIHVHNNKATITEKDLS